MPRLLRQLLGPLAKRGALEAQKEKEMTLLLQLLLLMLCPRKKRAGKGP